jgi:hypothetical protein
MRGQICAPIDRLATQHADAHGMTMNEALGLAPTDIDGFDQLFDAYVRTVQRYERTLWGYIEIDQGGCANKRKTRARLEAMGLRPIPVYHPLNDGWDYFDELAQQYDRICLGNVVMASSEQRKRLLSTVWERRRKYPHLWIHALGMTPNDVGVAYPMNSFDSSAWLSGVRYGSTEAIQVQKQFSRIVKGFTYDRDKHPEHDAGHIKARKLAGYNAIMLGRTLHNIRTDLAAELGADVGLFDHHHG